MIFDINRRLFRKRYEIVTVDHYNRKSQVADRSTSVPMTLSDLERRGMRGQNFLADLQNYAGTV